MGWCRDHLGTLPAGEMKADAVRLVQTGGDRAGTVGIHAFIGCPGFSSGDVMGEHCGS